jgi:hypothetical protein
MLGFGPSVDRRVRQEWWRRQIQRQQDGSLSNRRVLPPARRQHRDVQGVKVLIILNKV